MHPPHRLLLYHCALEQSTPPSACMAGNESSPQMTSCSSLSFSVFQLNSPLDDERCRLRSTSTRTVRLHRAPRVSARVIWRPAHGWIRSLRIQFSQSELAGLLNRSDLSAHLRFLPTRYYEPPQGYEGKHRFDVNARWTLAEEKALLRKVDLRVCLFVCICFAALQLDRGNVSLHRRNKPRACGFCSLNLTSALEQINQAVSDNMLDDLGMTTNEYSR